MEEKDNYMESMTISDDSLTFINEKNGIEAINLNQKELTMEDENDKHKQGCSPHDKRVFYFN